jgi:hypothetical protein
MKKIRDKSHARRRDLYPATSACPQCQQRLAPAYQKKRYIITLSGMVCVVSHFLTCQRMGCGLRGTAHRPEAEALVALPGYTFGLDVIAYIGQRRFRQWQTIPEIHRQLVQEHSLSICVKEVALLAEVFLALVTTVASQDQELMTELRQGGSIVLSIDGVQPEKGNEVLYLLREVRLGRVLAAANVLSSSAEEIGKLIEEVLVLGLPIVGVISDHQESIELAIERHLPGVPHQICQLHYWQQLAQPAVTDDRTFRTALKKPIRDLRRIERRAEQKRTEGKITKGEAEVVQDYCLALRTCLNQDGRYPLDPPGVQLYEHLHQVAVSVDRCLHHHPSSELKSLKKILSILPTFERGYQHLKTIFETIRQTVHYLDAQGSGDQALAALLSFLASALGTDPPPPPEPASEPAARPQPRPPQTFREHALKVTRSFGQKLFAYLTQPLVPTTTNDLELFIGQMKKSRRHITGRKNTQSFILREGAFVAVLFGLPRHIPWLEKFAAVPLNDFRTALAKLRRREPRSKLWLIRRDLNAYLSRLEAHWFPP